MVKRYNISSRNEDAFCADATAMLRDRFRESNRRAKRSCFLENCYYETRKTIQRSDVIMKHARRRKARIITCRKTSMRNTGVAFAVADPDAL